MRILRLLIIYALCAVALMAAGCTSLPIIGNQDVIWREITRRDMDLLDCGITGSLPTRLNECGIRNPAYARHNSKSGHTWHLVMVDKQLRLEFWADQQTGSVWTNILPYRKKICAPLGSILNGDKEMVFKLAGTVDYQIAFDHPLPFTIQSQRARYFVLSDSEESGVAADEQIGRFMNIDSEDMLWARCVAKIR